MVVLSDHLLRCRTEWIRLNVASAAVLAAPVGQTEPDITPARQIQRRLTPTERVALVQAYQAGATMIELAAQFGIHEHTVSKCLHDLAVPLRRLGLNPNDIADATRLYQEGWSLARVGEKFDCDPSTIRNQLRAHGVQIRPGQGGRKLKL